jgi:hypothetical protein
MRIKGAQASQAKEENKNVGRKKARRSVYNTPVPELDSHTAV